jgi:hypothetical protein
MGQLQHSIFHLRPKRRDFLVTPPLGFTNVTNNPGLWATNQKLPQYCEHGEDAQQMAATLEGNPWWWEPGARGCANIWFLDPFGLSQPPPSISLLHQWFVSKSKYQLSMALYTYLLTKLRLKLVYRQCSRIAHKIPLDHRIIKFNGDSPHLFSCAMINLHSCTDFNDNWMGDTF